MAKKILYIFGITPVGGVGTYVKNLITNLNDSNYIFSFLAFDENIHCPFYSFAKDNGIPFYHFSRLKFMNILKIKKALKVFFCKNKFDIVEIHSPNVAFLCAKIAKQIGGAKVIIHYHNTHYSNQSILKGIRNYFLEMHVDSLCDHFIACGEKVADIMLLKRGVDKKKISIVKNGIKISRKTFSNNEIRDFKFNHNIPDSKICLSLGNCTKQKNYSFLLKIAKELNDLNYTFIVAGEGKLKKSLMQKCKKMNISNVFFIGYFNNPELLISIADVMIMPSLFEGLPLSLLECQLYGVPILASDTITEEVKINSNVCFLSLKERENVWAKNVIELSNMEKSNIDKIYESNFNIDKTVMMIKDIYNNL